MLLYPAIDLMNGQAVRLRQGRAEEKTVYSDDPVAVAREWEARGGDWLHVVDLDAAFTGAQSNIEIVRRMAASISIPVQLGGGIRDEAAIERALGAGVSRVVIGTRAAEADDFVGRMVGKFGRERIAVGIDAKDGFVAVRGWTESTKLAAFDLALQAVKLMVAKTKVPVISSGGVSSAKDLTVLAGVEGLSGAIVGKALFDGLIQGNLREAMNAADT